MGNVLSSLIALCGVAVTAGLGYRQWRKQQDSARNASFRDDRRGAYKVLWEKVEEIHVRLRVSPREAVTVTADLQAINSFALLNSLYIDPKDVELVNSYLNAVRRLAGIVASDADKGTQERWSATQQIPPSVLKTFQGMKAADEEIEEIRGVLISRFRNVMRGKV